MQFVVLIFRGVATFKYSSYERVCRSVAGKVLTMKPIVNYRNAPSYYIAKILANWLKKHFELPFKYNVKNSKICAERIRELNIHSTYRM
jgi:hypothetical protein